MNDIRFAFRQLFKAPAFSILAVVTLAIGIGMNTAIFSLMHQLILRGLPFQEPDRIVRIYGEAKERELKQLPFSVPKFGIIATAKTYSRVWLAIGAMVSTSPAWAIRCS